MIANVNDSFISVWIYKLKVGFNEMVLSVLFIIALLTGYTLKVLPLSVVVFFIAISVFTWLLFAWDKYKAIKGKWRIKEASLHLLSLVGGWPGALIALKSFNHKHSKAAFTRVLYLIVIIHLMMWGGVIYYFNPWHY